MSKALKTSLIIWIAVFSNIMFIYWLAGGDFSRSQGLASSYFFATVSASVISIYVGLLMDI